MLRIYRAPNGRTYQYEEGEQPADHVPADQPEAEPKPQAKARRASNKARKPEGK